jgi:hypothetical protein
MSGIPLPTLLAAAFCSGAGSNKGALNTLGTVASGVLSSPSISPGASLADGFPLPTMTSPLAGGVPPAGGDFNAILNYITAFQAFVNSGGQFPFNAALALAIGGYQIGNEVQLNTGLAAVTCTTANNTTDPNTLTATQLAAGSNGWVYSGGNGAIPATANTYALRDSTGGLTVNALNASGIFSQLVAGRIDNVMKNTAAPTDQKEWDWSQDGAGGVGSFNLLPRSDSGVAGASALQFTRTGNVCTGLTIGQATTVNGTVTANQFNGSAAGLTGLPGIIQGQRKNLKASATGTSVTVTETVDAITLTTAGGAGTTTGPLSLSGALTTSGLNGLDNATPQACTISVASPAVVTLANHGFLGTSGTAVGNNVYSPIVFAGTVPTGLTAGTTYYVLNLTANTFNVSATPGGAAINTTAGSSAATVASVLAGNCWYSRWEISNGATPGLLFSSSATNPNLPAGYTYKALTGWVYTDNVNKFPLAFTQTNDFMQWKVTTGSNVAGLLNLSSGVQGSITTPTWVNVATNAFVSPNASQIEVVLLMQNATGNVAIVAPNNSYGAYNSTTNPPPISANIQAGVFGVYTASKWMTLESSNIYWASNSATNTLFTTGFQMNL